VDQMKSASSNVESQRVCPGATYDAELKITYKLIQFLLIPPVQATTKLNQNMHGQEPKFGTRYIDGQSERLPGIPVKCLLVHVGHAAPSNVPPIFVGRQQAVADKNGATIFVK